MSTLSLLGALVVGAPAHGQGPAPDFVPDHTFQGSEIGGLHRAGQAQWTAQNGVITGTAGAGGGGWLFLDRSYQDVAFFSRFRCAADCDAGVLLRAERTPQGMQGIFVSLRSGDVAPYRVTLDNNGRIVTRELARGGGGGGGGGGAAPAAPVATSPILAAATAALTAPVSIVPGQWNSITIFLDRNSIANHLNNVRNAIPGGTVVAQPAAAPAANAAIVPPNTMKYGYGPIALYVGSGSAEFAGVSTRDLTTTTIEPERTSDRFRAQRIDDFYYAWGADVADVNRDGAMDIVSGPFYYLGPAFTARREFYPARVFNPGIEYANDMITFAHDWTGDGWPDVLVTERRPMVLYANPKGEARRWDRHEVLPEICSESVVRGDLFGDGRPAIVYIGGDGRVAFARPDPADPTAKWPINRVSAPIVAGCNTHGIGIGDVNRDGRPDILSARGWWEQPATGAQTGPWIAHEAAFGALTRSPQHPGGAEISVYDFNGDGLNDVVTSESAHGWGLSWYEQKRAAGGARTWQEHRIMGDYSTPNAGGVTFSQLHSGATLADVDGDRVMDFITGKRHWSHLDSYSDPDPHGPAVVYWYRSVRNSSAPGGVEFVPHLIHNRSGVGSELKVRDIDGNGTLDIVTAGTRGLFVFWGLPRSGVTAR
ncbi:MAG: VCBS repeat-containing protein [Gemmatimonadetes bacterium]|nr:VCBS repeat-containing protein [Gemmatimonadota bacterium]